MGIRVMVGEGRNERREWGMCVKIIKFIIDMSEVANE